ncbi:MAG: ATP-binding cassette domain-containing protein, partial [Saprospiraceae bacterium]|nr:ATP-binding cassette domain-containing protein [Saprospiraceae bacterium]
MIEAKNIFKSFDDHDVLKDISIVFETGKCNLIIGSSGAGKTVLLKILAGLMRPTKGEV